MEDRISAADEKRMVAAIERAATIASMDDKADRNALLARELTAGNVDGRFAKVASAAFNKRLTVLTFKNTDDARRGESFALADPETVAGLMGAGGHAKTASASTVGPVFRMGMVSGGMEKAAKAGKTPKARPRYEDTVSNERLERHMLGMMEKLAAANTEMLAEIRDIEARISEEHPKVVEGLRKCSGFEFRTLCNYLGDRLESAMSEYMPDRDFSKTASVADPDTPLSRLAGRLLDDIDSYIRCNDVVAYFQDGLEEFSKSAAAHAERMRKSAASAPGQKPPKGDADADNDTFAHALKTLGGLPPRTIDTAREYMDEIGSSALGYGAIKELDTLNQLIQTRDHATPADVITSEFVTKDRYHDRMLAWSDMSADPLLAMYPAKSVFLATQKAMDMHPALESPEYRELLRAYVAQLLAQNNRASTADLAALLGTLEHAGKSPKGPTADAAALAEALGDKEQKTVALPDRQLKYTPLGDIYKDVKEKRPRVTSTVAASVWDPAAGNWPKMTNQEKVEWGRKVLEMQHSADPELRSQYERRSAAQPNTFSGRMAELESMASAGNIPANWATITSAVTV